MTAHILRSNELYDCEFKSHLENEVSMHFPSVSTVLLIATLSPICKVFRDKLTDSEIIKLRCFNGRNTIASNEMERMTVNGKQ
jgi:hypothetical protein